MAELAVKIRKTLAHYYQNGARRWRGGYWGLTRPMAHSPVFVVGCSRAGTTLVYKTLSESRQLSSLQRETHDFWADLHPPEERAWRSHALEPEDACDADREAVSRYFYTHTGSLHFVDKNNQNGLCVAYLHALFPKARFVYVKRSPGDNIHSLIQGWNKADEFATWSTRLPYEVQVDNGRYRRWCFFLADDWQHYLNKPIEDVCAFQYRAMNAKILAERAQVPSSQWVDVRYEDLVRDPVGGFRILFERLGLPFDAAIETHCSGVLSRPYNAFSEIKLDKWRDSDHADRLERVLGSVADVARQMNYRV